jgi:hypothetical protein
MTHLFNACALIATTFFGYPEDPLFDDQAIFSYDSLSRTTLLSSFEESVKNLGEECLKGPTAPDYLSYLEGRIVALTPFAALLEEGIQNQFNQFATDFNAYKAGPLLELIEPLDRDLTLLLSSVRSLSHPLGFNQALADSLDRLEEDLTLSSPPFSKERLEYLKGQEYTLWLFASAAGALFDKVFDDFDDHFDNFVESPDEANLNSLLKEIKQLQECLNDDST